MNLGIGAMMHYLSGGSKESADKYYGRKIKAASMKNEKLNIAFEDGSEIQIFDNGPSCCESRYMRTDDDVNWLVGKTLKAINTKPADNKTGEYGEEHECVFLEIDTNEGCITFSNHNEHNGYYGGFGLTINEVRDCASSTNQEECD